MARSGLRGIPAGKIVTSRADMSTRGSRGLRYFTRAERTLTTQAHDTAMPVTTPRRPRRADAGSVRLSQRDIDGLMLCGEHYGAPLDLLAGTLRVSEERLPAITARWRRAGYAADGPAGAGAGVVLADPGRG